jgi:outer membrane protein assembly factor BamE (lipoprotein component of BamABCDE complex)
MNYIKIIKLPLASLYFIIAISLILSGCKTLDIRGQYVDDATLKRVENTRASKSEVENILGTPMMIPDYSPDTWYYVQRIVAKKAWFNPKVVEQRVVKVTFDNNYYLKEVIVLADSHKDINIIGQYTKAHGTELNPIQKFVKNIGRFNKATEGKKKRKR